MSDTLKPPAHGIAIFVILTRRRSVVCSLQDMIGEIASSVCFSLRQPTYFRWVCLCLSACLSVCLSVGQSVGWSVHPSVCLHRLAYLRLTRYTLSLFCKLYAPTRALNDSLPPHRTCVCQRAQGHCSQLPWYSTDLYRRSFVTCCLYWFVKQ